MIAFLVAFIGYQGYRMVVNPTLSTAALNCASFEARP
jgi:hypothetical protein